MSEHVLPRSYRKLLRAAVRKAYRQGVSAGRTEITSGLKALAVLNGSAVPLMRITKAFDESKVVRDAHGRFATKQEIAEAASDPEKRKQLESTLDDENKAKLAAAIEEHKGKPTADSSTTHTEAIEGLKKLHALFGKKGGERMAVSGPARQQLEEAIQEAADYVVKLNREELTKLKESLYVKVGGRKAEIAHAIASKAMMRAGIEAGAPKPKKYERPTAGHFNKIAKDSAFDKDVQANYERIKRETADEPAPAPQAAAPTPAAPEPAAEKQPHEMNQGDYIKQRMDEGASHLHAKVEHYDAVKRAAKAGTLSQDVLDSMDAQDQPGLEHDVKQAKAANALQHGIANRPAATPTPAPANPAQEAAARAFNEGVKPDAAQDPKEQQIRQKIEQYSRWLEEAKRGEGHAGPTRWSNNAIHQKNYQDSIDFHKQELAKHLADKQAAPAADQPHYVSGGNTYPHRQLLSQIGGRWDMTKRRWVIPAAALSKLPPGLRGVPL